MELLELQMRDMTKLMEENERKQQEVENEHKEAVEKIYVLREIIRDLESQIETKVENETDLKKVIAELEAIINQQTKTVEELSQELGVLRSGPDASQCQEIISRLEGELKIFKLNSELTGNESVLQHIKIQVCSMVFETIFDFLRNVALLFNLFNVLMSPCLEWVLLAGSFICLERICRLFLYVYKSIKSCFVWTINNFLW